MDATGKSNLLIVEDEPPLREIVREAAERTGVYAEIVAMPDGKAAHDFLWARIRAGGSVPDIVLSDLSMPRLDGLELIRALKQHPETKAIPVVIMTSSNRPNDREDATAAGCSAFFNKPLRLDSMLALLESLPRLCHRTSAARPGAAA